MDYLPQNPAILVSRTNMLDTLTYPMILSFVHRRLSWMQK